MNPVTTYLGSKRSKRTNFLGVGVTLCGIVAAICAAPLAFVQGWIAFWLLSLMTILILGVFGIWAHHAIKNPKLLDTEDHREQMAAISVLGLNQPGKDAIVRALINETVIENPQLSAGEQK